MEMVVIVIGGSSDYCKLSENTYVVMKPNRTTTCNVNNIKTGDLYITQFTLGHISGENLYDIYYIVIVSEYTQIAKYLAKSPLSFYRLFVKKKLCPMP